MKKTRVEYVPQFKAAKKGWTDLIIVPNTLDEAERRLEQFDANWKDHPKTRILKRVITEKVIPTR